MTESRSIDVPEIAAEFTFDTSRAILNLIWTGTAERHPRIRWIFSHVAGTAPSQILFGSDFPFAPAPTTKVSIEGLDPYLGFDTAHRRAILRDDTLAPLPRLAERLEKR